MASKDHQSQNLRQVFANRIATLRSLPLRWWVPIGILLLAELAWAGLVVVRVGFEGITRGNFVFMVISIAIIVYGISVVFALFYSMTRFVARISREALYDQKRN